MSIKSVCDFIVSKCCLKNEATNPENWRVTAVMEIDKKYFNL